MVAFYRFFAPYDVGKDSGEREMMSVVHTVHRNYTAVHNDQMDRWTEYTKHIIPMIGG